MLEAGGNAVDACIAAAVTSWVTESPLTGPGGGGFMLVHSAADGRTRLLDFYVAVPGLGLDPGLVADMVSVDVDFSGSTQVFRIGPPSCAVPGALAGLEAAHREFATLPWRELFGPALELARRGFELTTPQANLHSLLDLILRHTADGRAIYGQDARLVAGDLLALGDLADTLELLAERGADELYRGELGRAMVEHVRAGGGAFTRRDLEEYRVIRRQPAVGRFRGHELRSNPPPSSGGVLIVHALRLLDRLPPAAEGSAEATAVLAEVMRELARVRARGLDRWLRRGGLAARLAADEEAALERIRAQAPAEAEPREPMGTTHISVVDGQGNVAALTISTGAGSGVVVPGTGIHLNNMVGEFELPRPPAAGTRLSSMMSPSLVTRAGRARLVVGSAGSLRLRNAVLQVIVNVVAHQLGVEEAVTRPRVHYEEPYLHCEGGFDAAKLDRLEGMGYELVRWQASNVYFGGAAAVEVCPDGTLAAAGDPRRGGHGIVVE
jgi:gamma-glutamyltranspeptidase / glutathione hydrolase